MSSGRSPIERRASSVRSQKSPLSHVPTMRQLLRDATKDPDALSSTIEINDYVQTVVNKIVVTGIVRFIGVTDFAKGIWVGVELPMPQGKNDGTCLNRRYFTCKNLHGVFARHSSCTKITTPSPSLSKSSSGSIKRVTSPSSAGSPATSPPTVTSHHVARRVQGRSTDIGFTHDQHSSQSQEGQKISTMIDESMEVSLSDIYPETTVPQQEVTKEEMSSPTSGEDLNFLIKQLLGNEQFLSKIKDISVSFLATESASHAHDTKSDITDDATDSGDMRSVESLGKIRGEGEGEGEGIAEQSMSSATKFEVTEAEWNCMLDKSKQAEQSLQAIHTLLTKIDGSLLKLNAMCDEADNETETGDIDSGSIEKDNNSENCNSHDSNDGDGGGGDGGGDGDNGDGDGDDGKSDLDEFIKRVRSGSAHSVDSLLNTSQQLVNLSYHNTAARDAELEEKDFSIMQLKNTLEIVAHMSKQAADLVVLERTLHQDTISSMETRLQKYETEIAKKYAILH